MKVFNQKVYIKDNLPDGIEEDSPGKDNQSDDDTDNENNDGSIPRIIYDNSESEQGIEKLK